MYVIEGNGRDSANSPCHSGDSWGHVLATLVCDRTVTATVLVPSYPPQDVTMLMDVSATATPPCNTVKMIVNVPGVVATNPA